MRVLMINVVCGIRSTGRICTDLAAELEAQGHEVKIAYGRFEVPEKFQKYAVRIGSDLDIKLHGLKARLLDGAGFGSRRATEHFIDWVKEYDPDVIHLHNIHGYYINVEVLFKYLKTCGKKVIWTQHDCWAFTGHCAYFDYASCERWKTDCNSCPCKMDYPACQGLSRAKQNYNQKKKLFTEIPNMTLITPSYWLAGLIKDSYLRDYPVSTIHNGVDTSMFKHTEGNIKHRFGIENKRVVLGVAAIWDKRKGLEYMVEVAGLLGDEYKVVVIGVTEEQKAKLPESVLGILHTNSVKELVEWYSAADVYVNPTLEDNYPTTNIEAVACGTPVITFNTGGSIESVPACNVVEKGDINRVADLIRAKRYQVSTAVADKNELLKDYLELYVSFTYGRAC